MKYVQLPDFTPPINVQDCVFKPQGLAPYPDDIKKRESDLQKAVESQKSAELPEKEGSAVSDFNISNIQKSS